MLWRKWGLGETIVLSCGTVTVFTETPVNFRMSFIINHLDVICVWSITMLVRILKCGSRVFQCVKTRSAHAVTL